MHKIVYSQSYFDPLVPKQKINSSKKLQCSVTFSSLQRLEVCSILLQDQEG